MFYGATPRVFDGSELARVACTQCNWVSLEMAAPSVRIKRIGCRLCGREVDRYMVYNDWERRRALFWLRRRFGRQHIDWPGRPAKTA